MFTVRIYKIRYLKVIIVLVILILFLGLRFPEIALYEKDAHSQNHSTATNSETITQNEIDITPVVASSTIERLVPYSRTGVWNTPIGPSPKYDPYSDQMIANLALINDGEIITPNTYNYPVYFVDRDTPRYDVPCTKYKCSVATSDSVIRTDMLKDVPIPLNAHPSSDSDGRMIIIDKITYAEYDFWQAKRVGTRWTSSNGSSYNIRWNGTPIDYSSRGAGVPSYAGLIRPWEILQGKIEHALAFGVDNPAEDKCVFPASKSDGDSTNPYAIPEGARLQLDPSLTGDDFDQMGLDQTGKIIARALQEYGMILVDHSGSFKIYLEDLTSNPYVMQEWTDPELNLTNETISNIPYTSFRVLELPPGYWEQSAKSQYHGKCLTFPGLP